jgi:hypothetical protein
MAAQRSIQAGEIRVVGPDTRQAVQVNHHRRIVEETGSLPDFLGQSTLDCGPVKMKDVHDGQREQTPLEFKGRSIIDSGQRGSQQHGSAEGLESSQVFAW